MAPAITLTVAGFGLFVTSFAADLYGTSGASRIAGDPERERPAWETELGVLRVHNPWFDFDWLVAQRVAANLGRFRVLAALETATDASFARYQLGTSLRAFGPRLGFVSRDGSFFDLNFALTEQRYVVAGFVTDTGEMLLTGRLDLERVGPTLRGSFVELSAGTALARTRYEIDGLKVPADVESLLLGRLAFGAYLGRALHRGSEAMLYYDHRHDDYAAGTKVPGLGSGTIGHFGLSGRYYWSRHLGVGAAVEVGSAYVAGLSLLFRAGGGA